MNVQRVLFGGFVIVIIVLGVLYFQKRSSVSDGGGVQLERIVEGEQIAIGGADEYDIDDDVLWDNDGHRDVRQVNLEGFHLRIKTPTLSIDAPVVDGVSLQKLAQGIGHHITTAYPNDQGGNVVLSGHRWYPGQNPYYRTLIDVDRLEVGDEIQLTYDGKEYTYRVERKEVVPPDYVSVLTQTAQPQLTLYTCTPKYTAKNRLVFVAPLVAVQPQKAQ